MSGPSWKFPDPIILLVEQGNMWKIGAKKRIRRRGEEVWEEGRGGGKEKGRGGQEGGRGRRKREEEGKKEGEEGRIKRREEEGKKEGEEGGREGKRRARRIGEKGGRERKEEEKGRRGEERKGPSSWVQESIVICIAYANIRQVTGDPFAQTQKGYIGRLWWL